MPRNVDLISRLREEPTETEMKVGIDAQTTRIWNDLCFEAADEVEQLREALKVVVEETVSVWGALSDKEDKHVAVELEVERYREALEYDLYIAEDGLIYRHFAGTGESMDIEQDEGDLMEILQALQAEVKRLREVNNGGLPEARDALAEKDPRSVICPTCTVGAGAYCQTSDGSFHSSRWQAALNPAHGTEEKR
jgi:hypothetical protein